MATAGRPSDKICSQTYPISSAPTSAVANGSERNPLEKPVTLAEEIDAAHDRCEGLSLLGQTVSKPFPRAEQVWLIYKDHTARTKAP